MNYQSTIITGYSGLTDEDLDSLRDQDVCLDDWDYMIFIEGDIDVCTEDDFIGALRLVPKDYQLTRLINGCCDNTWHRLTFRGVQGIMGVAYHS